jgi:hypothetical protein
MSSSAGTPVPKKRKGVAAGMPSASTAAVVASALADSRMISSTPGANFSPAEPVEISPMVKKILGESRYGAIEGSLGTPDQKLSQELALGRLPGQRQEAPAAPIKASEPPSSKSLLTRFNEVALENQEKNLAAATAPSGAYIIKRGTIGTNEEVVEAAKKLGGRRRKTKHRTSKRHTRKHRKTRRRVHFDRI